MKKIRLTHLPFLLFFLLPTGHIGANFKEKTANSLSKVSEKKENLNKRITKGERKGKQKITPKNTQKKPSKRKKKHLKVTITLQELFFYFTMGFFFLVFMYAVDGIFYLFSPVVHNMVEAYEHALIKQHLLPEGAHWGCAESYQTQKRKGHLFAHAYAMIYGPTYWTKRKAAFDKVQGAITRAGSSQAMHKICDETSHRFAKEELPAIQKEATTKGVANQKKFDPYSTEDLDDLIQWATKMEKGLAKVIHALKENNVHQKIESNPQTLFLKRMGALSSSHAVFPHWGMKYLKLKYFTHRLIQHYEGEKGKIQEKLNKIKTYKKQVNKGFIRMGSEKDVPPELQTLVALFTAKGL